MSQVKRYDIETDGFGNFSIGPDTSGRYVTFEDYAAMEKRVEAAEMALDLVRAQRDLAIDLSDKSEADKAELYAELYRLREEIKGPDGFDTWKDAAVYLKASKTNMATKRIDYLTAMAAHHSDEWHKMGPITGYMKGWNDCLAETRPAPAVNLASLVPDDTKRMDWLCAHCVEVRDPQMYGSHAMFRAQQDSEEWDLPFHTTLREQIDEAMRNNEEAKK